ncbi:HPr family phosphocarrier protein [Agromyces bauzanensis]|uniref:Phosphocarrier protein HPr n=1 Tax=Agromyces bauzanensis TaxID=1308924 RepID=A0A917PR94_9MICO|nr:HPr family phosphocarrier protein [Agromyces bauzanensis]GGJ88064.1 phosphocarrier protein HPr [Agromyces bauzanensis]
MVERTVRIGSTHGLHARPAKLFTQAVAASGTRVMVQTTGGPAVNAASILAVIAQGIDHGDERAVLDELVELLSTDHDE